VARFERLEKMGLWNGELISKELPVDMQQGTDRDSGG